MLNITPKTIRLEGESGPIPVNLDIRYPREWGWGIAGEIATLRIDGHSLGTANLKEGINLSVAISTGAHILEISFMGKEQSYTLNCPDPGNYEALLSFSRMKIAFSMKLSTPSGLTHELSVKARPDIGGLPSDGHFFTCKIPNTGPLGIVEQFSLTYVTTSTMRSAAVKIQGDNFTMNCYDSSGGVYEAINLPVRDITSVEKHSVRVGRQILMNLARTLAMTFGLGIVIGVLVFFKITIRNFQDTLMFIGISLAMGFVLAFLFVFLPGLFRIKSSLTQLVFHTKPNQNFGAFVTQDELTEASKTLEWAGIKLS